jgi:hypothetical protein
MNMNYFHKAWLAVSLTLVTLAGAAEPESKLLFGAANAFRAGELQARGIDLSVAEGRLRIEAPAGDMRGQRRGIVFPLRGEDRNLARLGELEIELANTGSAPVVFTFWALSGPGWGGVSTYSTTRSESGRETLAPGERGRFRIDLHARYPGREVFTKAIDPADVRSLELVFEPARAPASLTIEMIRAIGHGPAEPHDTSRRVRVPEVQHVPPGPGRRVYQKLPGWETTEVAHVLTLPRNWQPGRRYPVIVEYTGNVFYHKFCRSTGRTDQGNLAYGLARGEDLILLNLPFISEDGRYEQVDGWGDIAKTADYCLAALEFIREHYGADPRAVFYTGFSRGSYAANYLALRDDRIASVWAGFLTLRDPGAPWKDGARGWRGVDVGWNQRAARMNGRPWFHQDDELGPDVHVDVEFFEDRPSTVATRRWLQDEVARLAQERVQIDADFPGGNIVVDKIEGDDVYVHQDLRDTKGDWFYWYFRVRGAEGRELTFHFTKSRAIGLLGPGISRDGGRTWQWLGGKTLPNAFRYKFAAGESDVRFSFGLPYQHADLTRFLQKRAGNPHLRTEELARTRKGTPVERLHAGRIDGDAPHKILITCRSHACEMMASYVLEGIIDEILSDSEDGRWLQRHVDFLIVPMVDKDGVEAGDQGKNRMPHDHTADFNGESIYPEVAALREYVSKWAGPQPQVTFDLHDPAINHQVIYTHALRRERLDSEERRAHIRRFLDLLEQTHCGELKFAVQDSIEFAERKAREGQTVGDPPPPAAAPTAKPAAKVSPKPGSFKCTFEIPYAQVRGVEVNPDSARAFGHDIARALCTYLKTLP